MWYFLDKRGQPIEWLKGRRLSNFIRFLLYCRDITKDRPDSMYPCWVCHNCAHAIAYDAPSEWKDCPKCKVNGEAGVMFLVQRRYRPLTPGLTQGGSKNPPTTPRPDIKVPAQVTKPKATVDAEVRKEGIQELRTQRDHMDKMIESLLDIASVEALRAERDRLQKQNVSLKAQIAFRPTPELHQEIAFLQQILGKCERAANGWPDGPPTFHGCSISLASVEELRAKYDKLQGKQGQLREKMRQLCQAIDDEIPESPDIYDGLNVMSETGLADWENWCGLLAECKKLSSLGNTNG